MTTRALAAYLGAALCLTWAVLTAVAYLRGKRPVPATRWQEPEDGIQGADPRSLALAGGWDAEVRWIQ